MSGNEKKIKLDEKKSKGNKHKGKGDKKKAHRNKRKIKNFSELIQNSSEYSKERRIVLELIEETMKCIKTKKIMREHIRLQKDILKVNGGKFDLRKFENIYVIGAGKASGKMAEALEEILGERISDGWINSVRPKELKHIKVIKAGHPIPNPASVKGTEEILKIAKKAGERDLVICLISGGGSALMCAPAEGLRLDDLRKTNKLLVNSEAQIQYINSIRKHLSKVKGGLLAEAAFPATVLSVIISDVVGDKLDVIASGPTSPDKTSYRKALERMKKFWIWRKTPRRVKMHLKKGVDGEVKETPKPHDKIFKRVHNVIILNNYVALKAMKEKTVQRKIPCEIYSNQIEGEARLVGKELLKEALHKMGGKKEYILLAGGETTVTVKGKGKGGRNQELVLGTIRKLGEHKAVVASFGSDGIDGQSRVAGAIADGNSKERAGELGLKRWQYLEDNNSNAYFRKLKDTIRTGHTGTNVMDFQIIYVKK